jgi:NADH dehydrogenase FAD-containing subunit
MVMKTAIPKTRLLLVGGSLIQLCMINRLSKQEMERLKIILITPFSSVYYLEMASGYLEGTFTEAEIAIEVVKLCDRKRIHWIEATPVKIDIDGKAVTLEDGRIITFDILSLNPDPYGRYVEGVAKYGIPIQVHDNLKKIKQYFMERNIESNLTIVGSGKLGVEVALAIRLLVDKCRQNVNITIIEAYQSLLPGYDIKVKKIVQEELKRQRIEILLGRKVIRVTGDLLIFNDNSVLDYGYLIWTAKCIRYPILDGSGLATDEQGRILVNPNFRTNKSDLIFACGECAAIQDFIQQWPEFDPDKEAEVLLQNIINSVIGTSLNCYIPLGKNKRVINLGHKRVVIQKHGLVSKGVFGWRSQKSRDEKFMKKLQ